jgi:N-methylhydantoinase B/oxoprolinase/acetone carboxylase alpha subunit
VIVPPHPGVASAFGTLLADRRVDVQQTQLSRSDRVDLETLDATLAAMAERARSTLESEGHKGEPLLLRSAAMRYSGQNYQHEVALPSGPLDERSFTALVEAFHEAHAAANGYRFDDEPVEIVHVTVTALGASSPMTMPGPPTTGSPQARERRDAWFDPGGYRATPVFRREELPAGWRTDGPCVIEEEDSTTVVLPGQRLEVASSGSLLLGTAPAEHARTGAGNVDAVTMSIVGDRLVSIAEEMGTHMMRAAYSPIFSESRDFSCALFNGRGELLAQGFFCPAHLGAIANTVDFVLRELGPESFAPGDVVLHNDPYRGGCHMPEHLLIRPIFSEGRLVAFAATIGHLAEIGAMAVGSFASNATEVFQEGLRLPPVKLLRRDEPATDVWKIVLSNHRTPRATWGDLHAMLGSLRVGERRFLELVGELGLEGTLTVCDELLEHGDRVMRARISSIPDGEFRFEDAMEDDGISAVPLRIRVLVVVDGDEIVVDYTGSDPQARGPVNATFGVTTSATYNALFQLAGAGVPRNAGAYRCATTIAPHGSVVNVAFPGPSVGGNTETQPKLVGMILGALADALPEKVMAAEGVTSCNFLFGGHHPATGEPYAHYHFEASGWGGRFTTDGNSAQNHIHGNCDNTPVEVFETRFPLRVRSYGLVQDSGGPGRRRGGLAVRRVIKVTAPEITVSALMDRVKEGAWGLSGGSAGRPAAILVRRRGETELHRFDEVFGTVSPSKFANIVLREGDEVVIESAGGGGYGRPLEREPELVLRDVADGFVSAGRATLDYGVAIVTGPGGLAIDGERTRRLRDPAYAPPP